MNSESSVPVLDLLLEDNVLTVALNRPQVHNALNPRLIGNLTAVFREVGQRDDVRVVVLTGHGRSFCAGADLAHMRDAADYDFAQNVADGRAIYELMHAVDSCPRPVVGRINGAAIGGGTGLVSCCDSVVADERAVFAFSEVRLGLVPAVISPFVLAKIGPSMARELFLSGERFDAVRARSIGLVHHVVAEDDLDAAVAERVRQLLLGAPGAQAAVKQMVRTAGTLASDRAGATMAELIAERRDSAEGREGMNAFLQKRKPAWQA